MFSSKDAESEAGSVEAACCPRTYSGQIHLLFIHDLYFFLTSRFRLSFIIGKHSKVRKHLQSTVEESQFQRILLPNKKVLL
jgi:hypothetical protein